MNRATHDAALPATTIDSMFHGQLLLEQSRTGYRFSVDAVLLAHRVAAHAPASCLEIGPGCGIVAIAAVWLQPSIRRCVAVEVQPSLAALCRANVDRNGFTGRIEVIDGDIRALRRSVQDPPFDVVFINPPYFRPTHGKVNPDGERAAARHQIHGSLAELLREARILAGARGTVELVMPAHELGDVLQLLEREGLRRQSVRLLHPRAGDTAELAMIGARHQKQWRTLFEPPLVMYAADGAYTAEMAALLAGATPSPREQT